VGARGGEWEGDELANPLAHLREEGSDLDLLGFDDRELQQLLDRLRRAVNECKAKLLEMRESVLGWCGPFTLPEPDEEVLTFVRELVFPEQREARSRAEASAAKAQAAGVGKS